MKKTALVAFTLLISCLFSSCAKESGTQSIVEDNIDRHGYETLIWSDEFNDAELNDEYWSHQLGTGSQYGLDGWGNQEAEYYKENNAVIRDGKLIITAKKESCGGKNYTSSRITTAGNISTTYGRIEAMISLPEVEGMWPAFWMLPESTTPYGGWASSGEIDIMEARGRVTDMTSAALHYGGVNQDVYKSSSHVLRDKEESISSYHVYAVEWEEDEFRFYVDDDEFMKVKKGVWFSKLDMDNENAPFDVDFHIILNLAVGGHFDGFREPGDDFTECEMKVEYVRIYKK